MRELCSSTDAIFPSTLDLEKVGKLRTTGKWEEKWNWVTTLLTIGYVKGTILVILTYLLHATT